MTITISPFSTASIDKAIRQIEQYQRNLPSRLIEVCRRLAEIGCDVAESEYAATPYDGERDVVLSYFPIENGYAVSALGETVLFLEFGAGVYYNSPRQYPDEVPPEILPIGEYGKGYGKRRAWAFYQSGEKVITRGNPPAAAMYYARREMLDRANEIIKEVFGT